MNDLSQAAIKLFQEKASIAAPELILCSVSRTIWRKYQALSIEVPVKFVSAGLWQQRDALKRAALDCGLTGAIVIMFDGRLCRSPIEIQPTQKGAFPMILNIRQQTTDGELARQIFDSDVSCAVVDLETGHLRFSSSYIHATSGRDEQWWMQNGSQLNAMWRPENLYMVNSRLKRDGKWEDAVYEAYSWECNAEGVWVRVPRVFHAKKLELTLFQKRISRVSWGVEIVN